MKHLTLIYLLLILSFVAQGKDVCNIEPVHVIVDQGGVPYILLTINENCNAYNVTIQACNTPNPIRIDRVKGTLPTFVRLKGGKCSCNGENAEVVVKIKEEQDEYIKKFSVPIFCQGKTSDSNDSFDPPPPPPPPPEVITMTNSSSGCKAVVQLNFKNGSKVDGMLYYGDGQSRRISNPNGSHNLNIDHKYDQSGEYLVALHTHRGTIAETINISSCKKESSAYPQYLYFWRCWTLNCCWIVALLVALYMASRLLLIGSDCTYRWPEKKILDKYIVNVKAVYCLEALGGSVALAAFASCPQESAALTLWLVLLAMLYMLSQLFSKEHKYPEWQSAMAVGVGILISCTIIINQ